MKIFNGLRNHFFNIFLIVAIGFGVYVASLGNSFLWDDEEQIVANPIIHSIKNIPSFFTSGIVYTPGQKLSGGFYRPMLTLVYTTVYSLSQGSAFGFRLFQVSIHLANSILVYLIFFSLFLTTYKQSVAKKTALLGSIVFAVHPGFSEGVLFIAGLGEPLFTLFLLLTFFFFIKSVHFGVVSILFFLLGLFTKETATVFFLIITFYFYLFLRKKTQVSILAPFIGVFLIYLFLRITIVGFSFENLQFPTPIAQAAMSKRLLTVPYEVAYYFYLFFLPYQLSIAQHPVVESISDIRFWGSLTFLLFIILGIYYNFQKTKSLLFLFFVSWFFLGLLPVLNFIPLSATVAERWLYFPAVGLLGAACLVGIYMPQIPVGRNILIGIFLTYISFLAIRTFIRTGDWRNGLTLYKHDLEVNFNSFDLQNNYGVELFRQERANEAKKYFEKSIELNPKWWTSYNNLGVIYEREDDLSRAEEYYQKSITAGNYYLAFENLAKLYLKMGKFEMANEFLEKSIKYFPGSSTLHKLYAISLYRKGETEEALREAKIALSLEPSQENYLLFQKIIKREEFPN